MPTEVPLVVRLRDRNAPVVESWRLHFAEQSSVEIRHGEIFEASADAIVSPANSFGYMNGGIDAAYLERFGSGLQSRLQPYDVILGGRRWPSLRVKEIYETHAELLR